MMPKWDCLSSSVVLCNYTTTNKGNLEINLLYYAFRTSYFTPPPIHRSLRVVAHTARPAKTKMRVTAPEYSHPLLSQLSESLGSIWFKQRPLLEFHILSLGVLQKCDPSFRKSWSTEAEHTDNNSLIFYHGFMFTEIIIGLFDQIPIIKIVKCKCKNVCKMYVIQRSR